MSELLPQLRQRRRFYDECSDCIHNTNDSDCCVECEECVNGHDRWVTGCFKPIDEKVV